MGSPIRSERNMSFKALSSPVRVAQGVQLDSLPHEGTVSTDDTMLEKVSETEELIMRLVVCDVRTLAQPDSPQVFIRVFLARLSYCFSG